MIFVFARQTSALAIEQKQQQAVGMLAHETLSMKQKLSVLTQYVQTKTHDCLGKIKNSELYRKIDLLVHSRTFWKWMAIGTSVFVVVAIIITIITAIIVIGIILLVLCLFMAKRNDGTKKKNSTHSEQVNQNIPGSTVNNNEPVPVVAPQVTKEKITNLDIADVIEKFAKDICELPEWIL